MDVDAELDGDTSLAANIHDEASAKVTLSTNERLERTEGEPWHWLS